MPDPRLTRLYADQLHRGSAERQVGQGPAASKPARSLKRAVSVSFHAGGGGSLVGSSVSLHETSVRGSTMTESNAETKSDEGSP